MDFIRQSVLQNRVLASTKVHHVIRVNCCCDEPPKTSGNSERSKFYHQMDVSENNGTPKWMVYNGKPY